MPVEDFPSISPIMIADSDAGLRISTKRKSFNLFAVQLLFEQLDANREVSQTAQALAFFKALFDFIELSERCDIRSDLDEGSGEATAEN